MSLSRDETSGIFYDYKSYRVTFRDIKIDCLDIFIKE